MENSKLTAFRLKTYDSGTGWVIRDTATNHRIAADLKQEYAERIVRAVNAHDELVSALTECMKDSFIAANGMDEGGKVSYAGKRYKRAVDALSKATGDAE